MQDLESLPKAAISEIVGPLSSGKTSYLHAFLADITRIGESGALVDARNSFDPLSAAQAGVDLRRLLWIRGNSRLDNIFKAADLILHSGGFGAVVMDLSGVAARDLNSIPLSYWYRFRLAVENSPTRLIVAADQPLVKSCARVQLSVTRRGVCWSGPVFSGIDFEVTTRKARLQMVG
jgi:RecA DNA recombination protein